MLTKRINLQFLGLGLVGVILMGWPGLALAQEVAVGVTEVAVEYQPQNYANLVWTLIGGILVMFMQPGFTMVEVGLVQAKNAVNVLMKNYVDFVVGILVYFVIGFGIMFGRSAGGVIGTSNFAFLSSLTGNGWDNQWSLTFWFFQSVFCATSATIVSGAIAGRTRFSAYIVTSFLISAIIYPISGHWVWNGLYGLSEGWIGKLGFIDFSGSTVVHSVGGFVALAGAIIVGPRLGKYSLDGIARAIPGHNLSFAALGVFILWFSWFGFNCASTNVADGTVGFIAVNTNLAACAGFLGAMTTTWLKTGNPDPSMSFNGVLAGLVGITAGCYDVSPLGAVIIGLISGFLVVNSVFFIDQKLKVDDPVGAISVHAVCGVFGTLAVGLFASPYYGSDAVGLFYGGGLGLLGVQALGILAVGTWAFIGGLIIFKVADVVVGARVSPTEEIKGLDLAEHRTEAYSSFQFFTNN
ncbi:MAG: ammonium transporter [Candidatus Adiutrix intracellularis]|jgi:Amt family ammonium transporter|nr:MAG: ammonium transporter [Candidatus Adiutrix intracellularis]MDR2827627.1 ammonium transporter [Candidatus Adiutrix intracellularis]